MARHPRSPLHSLAVALVLAALSLLSPAGCQRSSTTAEAALPAGSKVYQLNGTVVSTDPSHSRITVQHRDIPGYMPGMTMPFTVKDPAVAADIKPKDVVRANLVVTADGRSWLQDVVIFQQEPGSRAAVQLPEELHSGEPVPDFKFVNQDGRPVRLRQLQGKTLLLTFIYTRCPLPTFCPLISSRFASLRRELEKDPAAYQRTQLLSVTFDLAYDTPPVLRRYGLAYIGNDPSAFAHWQFLAPPREELPEIAKFFGFEYLPQQDQIVHSMNTVLIGRDGRVVRSWPGNEWKQAELVAEVSRLAKQER